MDEVRNETLAPIHLILKRPPHLESTALTARTAWRFDSRSFTDAWFARRYSESALLNETTAADGTFGIDRERT